MNLATRAFYTVFIAELFYFKNSLFNDMSMFSSLFISVIYLSTVPFAPLFPTIDKITCLFCTYCLHRLSSS